MSDAVRHEIYGGFTSLVSESPAWIIGGFPLADGSFWEFREPDAVAVVQNGRLRVAVTRFTRSHPKIQVLDNAKHMFYSARTFPVPERGGIQFDTEIRAEGIRTAPGDLYDGFASLNLIEMSQGIALDWFCGHDRIAPVFARLPFPGATPSGDGPMRYFAIFDERPRDSAARHRVGILYDRAAADARWYLDGAEVWRQPVPAPLASFTVALGIMTEKDIGPAGSVSAHGQGLVAEWSPLEIATWSEPAARPAP
ncbi:MAG: DUF6081 family protein [Actinomycetota bacterium]